MARILIKLIHCRCHPNRRPPPQVAAIQAGVSRYHRDLRLLCGRCKDSLRRLPADATAFCAAAAQLVGLDSQCRQGLEGN